MFYSPCDRVSLVLLLPGLVALRNGGQLSVADEDRGQDAGAEQRDGPDRDPLEELILELVPRPVRRHDAHIMVPVAASAMSDLKLNVKIENDFEMSKI